MPNKSQQYVTNSLLNIVHDTRHIKCQVFNKMYECTTEPYNVIRQFKTPVIYDRKNSMYIGTQIHQINETTTASEFCSSRVLQKKSRGDYCPLRNCVHPLVIVRSAVYHAIICLMNLMCRTTRYAGHGNYIHTCNILLGACDPNILEFRNKGFCLLIGFQTSQMPFFFGSFQIYTL